MPLQGYIKLFRQIIEWEWYQDNNTKSLFIHLLLKANFIDKNWKGIDIKRGQVLTGLKSLSKQTGLSVQSLRTSIKRLKSTHEVTVQATNKYSIITICNYNDYNELNETANNLANNQSTNNQQATNKQLTTTKNIKNDKNDKNLKNKDSVRKFKAPNLQQVKDYVQENKYSVDPETFFKYFDEGDWIDSKGNKVQNWKQKLITWENKNINQAINNKKEIKWEEYVE